MANLNFASEICTASQLLLAVLLLSSCNIGNGIADFGNNVANPPTVAIGASHRVAAGRYSSPIVDPWDDRGPVIIAFEYLDDGPHLAMRPVDGSSGCDTGMAHSSIVRDKLDNRTQLVAYQDAGDTYSRGDVHFVDHYCHDYGPLVPHATLPDMLYRDPPGYLVNSATYTTVDGKPVVASVQLLVVDPWNATSTILAQNLTSFSTLSADDQVIAVVDSGHYKIIDGKRQVTSDTGTAVTEVINLSGSSGALALIDGGTLRTYRSPTDSAPVEIAKNACQASMDGGGCLFYYSPCDARQLQCYRADTGTSIIIDSNVGGTVASHVTSGSPNIDVLYTKGNSQSGATDLWLFSTGVAPAPIVPGFRSLYAWSPPPNLEIDALVNGDANTAQAIRHTTAGDTVLLDSVSVNFSQGLLANFDVNLSRGELYTSIQLGQTPQFLIADVPWVDKRSSIITSKNNDSIPYGTAVFTGGTGAMGNLTLMRYPSPSSPGPDSPRVIASNVPVGGCKFFENMNAIAFTENWDDTNGVGTFVVHQLELDARTQVSDQVREFQEVKWPAEGVMYIIPSGDRAGIWAAKAK